jgi:hypothetical protein
MVICLSTFAGSQGQSHGPTRIDINEKPGKEGKAVSNEK